MIDLARRVKDWQLEHPEEESHSTVVKRLDNSVLIIQLGDLINVRDITTALRIKDAMDLYIWERTKAL